MSTQQEVERLEKQVERLEQEAAENETFKNNLTTKVENLETEVQTLKDAIEAGVGASPSITSSLDRIDAVIETLDKDTPAEPVEPVE